MPISIKKISRNSKFSGSDKHIMLFFLLINVKMPTIVGILIFYEQEKNSCSAELSLNIFFVTSGLSLLLFV